MRTKFCLVHLIFVLAGSAAFGQGLIYDQRSTNIVEGVAGIQSGQPLGQSFTPTFSQVGFVQLYLYDGDVFNSAGGSVYVNLRSNSITGPILGSSAAVFMSHDFLGITNFFFSIPIVVIPGTKYYLQPIAEPGSDGFGSYVTDGSYTGGSAIVQGVPVIGRNLWFQEGIVVPEPSSALLVLLGSGLFVWRRGRKNFK